jgi:hypothetical protein
MEPIQDDIETLRTILNWVWATNPSTGSVAHHNARHGREALDRLVAKLAGTEAERRGLELERDRLIQENKRFIELVDNIQAENERMAGIVDSYVASGPTNQEARDFGIEAHNKRYALEQGIGAIAEKMFIEGGMCAVFSDELRALTKKSEA